MKKDKAKSVPAPDLRRLAEQRLRGGKTDEVQPQTELDTQRLLHELQVHQIELEMQNDELLASRAEVEAGLERYVDLYDFAPVGYFTLDRDGKIRQVNLTGASLLGILRSNLVGRKLGLFVAPEEAARWNQYLRSVGQSDDKQACELTFRREDESTFYARLEGIRLDRSAEGPRADGSGPVVRVAMSDVTGRRRASDYREMGREVLQILIEPGNLHESIHRVLAALKMRTGFDAVGIRLQDGEDFPYFDQIGFSTDFLLTENTLVERAADGRICRDKDGNASLECTCGLVISGKTDPANPLFTRGGSCWMNDSFLLLDIPPSEDPRLHPRAECIHQGYASMALVPIRDKDRIVGLMQFNDRRKGCFTIETVEILEGIASHVGAAMMRKRAEEALRQVSVALRRSNEDLGQFAYVASHDLQEPLRMVRGFLNLLKDRCAGQLDDKAREYIDYSVDGAERMAQLITDLLAYSRVDRKGNPMQPIDVNVPLATALSNLQISIEGAQATVTCEGLPTILGNVSQLTQLFQNLIGNAIKFRRPDRPCQVHVSATGQNGQWLFSVRDNGIGIPKDAMERVFKIFERLHTRDKYAGTGIGLAICKRIVERHEGRLWVESQADEGSTFFFLLPVSDSPGK